MAFRYQLPFAIRPSDPIKMTLRSAAYSAGRWTAASLLLRVLLQFAQMAILARLLAPADFGLMAIVGAVYAVAAIFVDLGLSNALIHFHEPSAPVLATLYWLNMGTSLLVMGLFILLAWPIATIYQEPRLLPIMLLMGLAIPLTALGQQFLVLAQKRLLFHKLAKIEMSSALFGFLAGILAAKLGAGVYSLVAMTLVSASTSSILAWVLLSSGMRPSRVFDLRSISPYLRYSAYRLGDTLLNNMQLQADLLIGGLVAGSSAMGIYTVPRNLSLRLANSFVNPIVTRVGLPVMARVQDDKVALKSVYLQTLRMTSSINFPVYMGLAIWSNEVVAVLLGDQWGQAAEFLRVFAFWGMIRSVTNPLGSLLYSTGHVKRAFWWNFVMVLLLPCILWFGARVGGTHGLATTMLLVQIIIFYPMHQLLVRPACDAGFRDYVAQLIPPLAATMIAAAISILTTTRLTPQWSLLVGAGVFGVVYLAVSLRLNEPWIRAMQELASPITKSLSKKRQV
jgi:O-antigen/teichoic acid export membrane protein